MSNPLLSAFELAGQQIDIRDSASYELATAAQRAADSANDAATYAQKTVNNFASGFNTSFVKKTGAYVSPSFCLRNNTVYIEFANVTPNKVIPGGSWVTACYISRENIPADKFYRFVTVKGTSIALVELNVTGELRMYSQVDISLTDHIFGGFAYLKGGKNE